MVDFNPVVIVILDDPLAVEIRGYVGLGYKSKAEK
jgi:hypothetical protein